MPDITPKQNTTGNEKKTTPKKKKNGTKLQGSTAKNGGMTRRELEHAYKLTLMRDCQIFGKMYDASALYFKSKGYTLGTTQFTDLRNELKSAKQSKEWFSKEALFVMEDDHMLSVERIRMMEDRLLAEFEQVASTNFYNYVNAGTKEQEIIRNKAHDGNYMLRLIAEFRALQDIKTKMFSATPLVQELMEVHASQEKEEEALHQEPIPAKQEKEIVSK